MLKVLKSFKAFLVIKFDSEHNILLKNKWKLSLVFVLFSYFHFIIIVSKNVKQDLMEERQLVQKVCGPFHKNSYDRF